MAGRVLPRRVQPDQLPGNLSHRLAGPTLGRRPLLAAELVQGGRLAAHVAGYLVQLIGRQEQPVRRLAPLARRVLQHHVLAGGAARRAGGHLHVLAHAVLVVHDVVPRGQRQRVDRTAALRRHPCAAPTAGRGAEQVGVGQHQQIRVRQQEARLQPAGGQLHAVRLQPPRPGPRGDVLRGQRLGQPLGGTGPWHRQQCRPARPAALGKHPQRGGKVSREMRCGLGEVRLLRRIRAAERRHPEPAEPAAQRRLPHLGNVPVGGCGQVDGCLVGVVGHGRVVPGGGQELLAGAVQLGGAVGDPLRLDQHHSGPIGQYVGDQFHALGQQGADRLHTLGSRPGDHGVQQVRQFRVLRQQRARPRLDLVGEREFAAGRCPQSVGQEIQRPLVGHREGAHLLHLVAPELHPNRVLGGGREDVEDPAAHCELPTALHQVGAGVADGDQLPGDICRIGLRARRQRDRREVGQPRHQRLQQGPDGHDHHLRGGRSRGGLRMAQPTQHCQPSADHVGGR